MFGTKKSLAGAKSGPTRGKKQAVTKAMKTKGMKLSGGGVRGIVSSKLPKGVKIKVSEVRNKLGLSQVELARVTGYSLRSIAGWEMGKPLSDSARQKLVETDRLRAALSEILPSKELGEWLRTPNPAFEGQTPIQVIERGEADRIWRMIVQIDAGVAS